MKHSAFWLAVVIIALAVIGGLLLRRKPTAGQGEAARPKPVLPAGAAPPRGNLAAPMAPKPEIAKFVLPPPVAPVPAVPRREVAIEDGKTIDFSTGKPVVKDTAAEKAAMERALREIEAAMRDVSFRPPPAPAGETKAAEPAKAPPKG